MRMASPPTLDGSVWLKKVPIMVKRNSRMNGIDAPHWRTICCQRRASRAVWPTRMTTDSASQPIRTSRSR